MALGSGSQTTTATGAAYRTGTAAPSSVVSVGTAGNERRIQNVSAGAADTDAVNVSQLRSVQDGVDQLGQSTAGALGGGSSYDPSTGAISNPNYTVNGNNVNNVGDAITELDKGWNLQSNGANAGAVKAGDTVDIGTADGEENLQVTKEGNDIKYSLNRDLKVDSVTAGDTVINNDGMTITGGPSVTKSGIDAAGNKITGVAAGTEGTDAVNVDQLNKAGQDLTDKGFGLTAQDGTTVQKKLGEAVDVVGADSNISTKVQDGKVAIELAKDLNVNSVTAGDTVMNTDGVTIAGGPSMTKSGIDAAGNKVTNVAEGDITADSKDAVNGSQLHNTAQSTADALGGGSTVNPDGTVSAPNYTVNGNNVSNVGDAITELDKGWNLQSNGANAGAVKAGDTVDIGTADGEENLQVSKEGNDIKYSLNRDLKVDSVTAGDTVINNDGMTITGGPSVTKSGIDAAGSKITGVAAGTDGTDAVNVDQLNQAGQDLTDKGFGLTAQDGTTVQKKLGEAVDVVGADSNISTKVQDGKVAIELAKDLNVNSVTAGDTVMNTDGVTIAGGPSMTKSGIDAAGNKVTNVAEGDITADSKDAVNGSQLHGTAQSTADALGGGSTVNPDGTVTAPNYSVNGTSLNNVGDAITELDKGWNLQSNGANSAAVKAGDTVDIGTADGEENLQVAKDGNNIKYSLNRDLKVDSVTAGDTVINNDGMTITGGPSVTKSGIDAADNKITNVAAGTEGTDAVNVDQLNQAGQDLTDKGFGLTAQDGTTVQKKLGEAVDVVGADSNISTKVQDGKVAIELAKDLNVNSVTAGDTVMNTDGVTIAGGPSMTKSGIDAAGNKVTNVAEGDITADSKDAVNGSQLHGTAQSTADALGGGSTVNPDGTVTAPNYTVNGNNVSNVGDAITELDKGWNLQSNGANSAAVKAGDTVDIGTADGEENLQVMKEGNDIKYSLNRDLKVDSVTAGDSVLNNDGLTIAGGPSVTKSGIDAAGNKISNVAAGTEGTDAVNVDQLNQAGQDLTDKGFGLTAQDGTTVQKKLGEAIDVVGADSNISTKVQDGKVAIELAKDLNVNSVTAGDTVMNTDGVTIAGGPSMTKSGIDAAGTKVTNVADGDITADSKDAVNGSQLHNTAQSTADALGGGSTVNPDGTVSAPNYSVNGTSLNNVGDAITELDKGWNLQSNGANSGAVKAGDTVDIGTADGEENLQVTKEGNDIKYSLNRDLKVDSVTAGDSVLNNDGLTIAGGPSVTKSGIDAAGNKISNVAAGTEGTDAVNVDQLKTSAAGAKTEVEAGKNMTVDSKTGADGQTIYTVSTADDVEFNTVKVGDVNIDGATGKITGVTEGTVAADSKDAINGSQLHGTAQSVSDALGGGSTVNPDGTVTAPNYTVNGNNVSNVGDAITELDKGWNLQSNGANAGAVKAGDTVDIGTADGEENLQVTKEGNDIKYSLNRDLKVDSVTAGDTVINNDGMTITGGPRVTKDGIDAAGKTISNVGPGVAGTDAVNKDQLDQASQDLTDKGFGLTAQDGTTVQKKLGEAVDVVGADENITTKVQDGKVAIELAKDLNVNSVTAGDSVLNNDGLTIANGPSVTKSGIDAAGNKVTNVAEGDITADSKDAVNGSQLHGVADSVKNSIGGETVLNPDGSVTTANVGNTGKNNIHDAIDSVRGAAVAAKSTVTQGDNIVVTESKNADGSTNYEVATARDVNFDSVKVGDVNIDGTTGKITGVTEGTVAADSKDAINGSQLHGTAQSVSDALGGGSTVNPDGTVTAPNYTVNGNNVSNVGDAITELDKGWTLQSNGANAGAVKAGDTVDIGTADGEENLKVAKDGNNIKYSLNRDLKVDSVTAGNTRLDNTGVEVKDPVGNSTSIVAGGTIVKDAQGNSNAQTAAGSTIKNAQGDTTLINSTGLAFTDASGAPVGPSVSRTGIDAGSLKVTNVAEGEVAADSKDAVNGSQLHGTAQSTADALGGGSTVNPDGTVTAPNYTVNGNNVSNVGDAITELDKGWNLQSNGANSGAVKAGDTVDIGTADGEENLQVSKEGNDIKYSLNRDLKVDSVTAGDTVINNDGMTIAGGPSVTKSGIDVAGNKISNVAAGTEGTDAVNKDQLDTAAAAAKTEVEAGKNMTVDSTTGEDGQTIYTVSTADDVEFNSVKVGDVNIDGATGKISGVTDGTVAAGSTEAVNGSQLHGVADSVKNSIGGETVLNPDGSVTTANVGNTGKDNIHDAIDSVRGAAVAAKSTVSQGDNMVVTESKNADGSTNYEVATARDVDFDSVKVGDVNIDGATGKITGVTEGTVAADSKDAVNGSQLHGTAQSTADALGGGSTVNPDGTVTAPNYTVNGNNVSNVGDAITELDKGWNLQSNGANSGAVKAGDTVDIGTADGEENLQVSKEGNDIKYSLNRDLKVDSVTAGDTVINNDGMTIAGGPSVTKSGIDVAGNKISNVAAGTEGTDAVNKDQLDTAAAAAKTEVEAGKNMTVDSTTGEDGQTIYTVSTADDVEFNSVKVGDVNIDGATGKISGVTDGTVAAGSTEAVNGSQLHGVADSVKNSIGGETVLNPDGSVTTANVGNTGKDNIHDAIDSVRGAAVAAKSTVSQGDNMVVTESKNADGSTNYEVATAKDVKFDSVTSSDEEGNETVLTAKGTQVKDGEGNEAEYGAKGISLKDADGNGTILNQGGLGFVDPMGNNIGPSITAKGIDAGNTVITGVAPGRVAADSQDAINGSQLKGVSDSVAGAIGGNTTVNPDGTINTSNIGGTGKDNINDAIGAVGDAAKAAKSTVSNEDGNITVNETTKPDGSRDYEVGLAKDIKVDSVTAGDTRIDGDGLHIEGGPSVTKDGIDAGDKKVTGVADGEIAKGSKDAVNGGQIKDISDSVAGAIGGNTTVNPDGTINTSNIGGTGHDNINDAIGAVGEAAKAAKSTVSNEDGNITVKESKNAEGGTDYEVGLAKDINVDSVTAKDANVIGENGSTKITGGGISITGPKGEQGPSMSTDGINAGGKKVTGVADGAITKDSKDAINGSQLHRSYEDVGAALGGGAGYDPEKGWKGPSYEVAGGKHDNVGDALGALDNADKALGDRITNLGDQMQQAFYDTNQRIDDVKKQANAGIAAAMALETAPYISGKYTYAVGAAYHGGENAVGVTLRKTADNGRWSLTTGVAAASQGDPSFRIGLSGVFD
ncbi:YadA-like family protein [Acinetobacter courvalinii]|uniref:YadA-like family protein n=1 Tax=Acinetobacter courvalinii TaxID=280147 RepID=UPI003F57E10D